MAIGNCIRCKSSLDLLDELELAPVTTIKGELCSRCYGEMSDIERNSYLGKS